MTKGLRCTGVERYAEHSWTFDFEGAFRLNVQCPRRIVDDRGIGLGGEDDGQAFGLSARVDGSTLALKLLSLIPLREISITEKTGDLAIEFESGTRLEAFNYSSGYEGWNCFTATGREVIGMGGGTTAHVLPSDPLRVVSVSGFVRGMVLAKKADER